MDPVPPAPDTASTEAPRYNAMIFHHEGAFPIGTEIRKGWSFGVQHVYRIDADVPNGMSDLYTKRLGTWEERLKQPDWQSKFEDGEDGERYRFGLSEEQVVRVHTAMEAVFEWNSPYPGQPYPPDEHSAIRNEQIYTDFDDQLHDPGDEAVPLSSVGGKVAMTCTESSAVTQQILGSTETIHFVSGDVAWNEGEKPEAHTFNVIKTADPKYAMAVLDVANPIYETVDGQIRLKLYCAPMTQAQWEAFQAGEQVALGFGGQKRTYRFGSNLVSAMAFKPQW